MLAPASNRGSSSGLIRNWQMTASCMMGAKSERQTPWPRRKLSGTQMGSTLMSRGKCWRWHRHAVNDSILARNGSASRDGDLFSLPRQGKARQRDGLKILMFSGSEQASLKSCVAAEADSRDKGSMAHLRQRLAEWHSLTGPSLVCVARTVHQKCIK